MALARFSEAGKFSLNKYNYSHSNSGVSDRRGILGKIRKLFHLKNCKAADSKIQGRTQGTKSRTNTVLFRAFPAFCWTFSFWFICFSPFPPSPSCLAERHWRWIRLPEEKVVFFELISVWFSGKWCAIREEGINLKERKRKQSTKVRRPEAEIRNWIDKQTKATDGKWDKPKQRQIFNTAIRQRVEKRVRNSEWFSSLKENFANKRRWQENQNK